MQNHVRYANFLNGGKQQIIEDFLTINVTRWLVAQLLSSNFRKKKFQIAHKEFWNDFLIISYLNKKIFVDHSRIFSWNGMIEIGL